jgi:hypothetical protein
MPTTGKKVIQLQTRFFYRICVFQSAIVASVKVLSRSCAGQLRSLESRTLHILCMAYKVCLGRGTHRSREQRNDTTRWNLRCVPKDIKSSEVRARCKPRPRGIATLADRPEFDVIFVLVCGAFIRPQIINKAAQYGHFYSY